MRARSILVSAAVAALLLAALCAAQDGAADLDDGDDGDGDGDAQDAPPQGQQLDKETINRILEAASPECRTEMEEAMQKGGDISEGCKAEIQRTMAGSGGRQSKPYDGPWYTSPTLAITVFLVVVVGGVGFFVAYANKEIAKARPRKGTAKYKSWLKKQRKKENWQM